MKNKGFTTIELIVSFALVSVMMILLFELVMNIKTLYLVSGIKTELLTKQALMTRKLNDDLTEYDVTSIVNCGVDCIDITYSSGTTKRLSVDVINGIYTYGNSTIKLIHDSSFLVPTLTFDISYNAGVSEFDAYFVVKIPVEHKLYKGEDFGVTAFYQFDSRITPLEFADFR